MGNEPTGYSTIALLHAGQVGRKCGVLVVALVPEDGHEAILGLLVTLGPGVGAFHGVKELGEDVLELVKVIVDRLGAGLRLGLNEEVSLQEWAFSPQGPV